MCSLVIESTEMFLRDGFLVCSHGCLKLMLDVMWFSLHLSVYSVWNVYACKLKPYIYPEIQQQGSECLW